MKLLALCGSIRKASWNQKLLNLIAAELREKGHEVDVFDLRAANIPVYDQDLDATPPPGVVDLKTRAAAAQGFVVCTPEYNYSVPGILKNVIDWVSRPNAAKNPLRDKLVFQAGCTNGPGGTLQAQMHLRHILNYGLGAWVSPSQYTLSQIGQHLDEAGNFKDPNQKKMLGYVLGPFLEELKRRNP
ncbi:MAG: NAD(P)H-dependent oxidoreductase [Myxococcaceae bacterium]|nr:NAD(P)H-dependent oxidoreductase [Myxococcaceae bacterium]